MDILFSRENTTRRNNRAGADDRAGTFAFSTVVVSAAAPQGDRFGRNPSVAWSLMHRALDLSLVIRRSAAGFRTFPYPCAGEAAVGALVLQDFPGSAAWPPRSRERLPMSAHKAIRPVNSLPLRNREHGQGHGGRRRAQLSCSMTGARSGSPGSRFRPSRPGEIGARAEAGLAARAALQSMLAEQDVELRRNGAAADRYGRILAHAYRPQWRRRSAAHEMLGQGFARVTAGAGTGLRQRAAGARTLGPHRPGLASGARSRIMSSGGRRAGRACRRAGPFHGG